MGLRESGLTESLRGSFCPPFNNPCLAAYASASACLFFSAASCLSAMTAAISSERVLIFGFSSVSSCLDSD